MLRPRSRYAFRRSRLRERVCEHLRRQGRVDGRALMVATGMSPRRLREVLFGGTHDYRSEESLVALGIVRIVREEGGEAVELTPRGAAEMEVVRALQLAGVPV